MVLDGIEDIIREFVVESNEGLDLLERDLVRLESAPGSADLLAEVFRAVHTIKGTSGVLGFSKLELVAHAGENLLSQLRDRKITLNPSLTTALLAMGDALRGLLREIDEHGAEGDKDCDPIVRLLEDALHQPPTREQKAAAAPAERCCFHEDDTDRQSFPTNEPESSQHSQEFRPKAPAFSFSEPPVGEVAPKRTDTGNQSTVEHETESPGPGGGNIRVDVALLDKIMNLVGELVLARNQIMPSSAGQSDAAFLRATQRLNLITGELQESVMKTRMQPIGCIWNRLPRLVRDLALQCGKQVVLQMEGSETELDRTILEAIKDPLTHIIRNSIDHGIEPPEERARAGKAAAGRVELLAFHQGGQVNLEVRDDGAGIDPQIVRERACECGLITRDQAAHLSEREVLELLFRPGFSTAEKVTNVSGRGVGMDVVKTNIERIGGTVDLQSEAGHGTTLKIKIPLTLAILPALIVTSGGQRFSIPRTSLLELVRLDGQEQIEHVGSAPVYRLRGMLLPIVFLSHELRLGSEVPAIQEASAASVARSSVTNQGGFPRPQPILRGTSGIVVLQANERQFGLVVDEINDTQEIVIKPLSRKLKGIGCFAGATILGDGEVVLILDVSGIAQRAGLVGAAHDHAHDTCDGRPATTGQPRQSWLLFRSTHGKRLAVSLSEVQRLEEFPEEQVEFSGEDEVVQYRGQIMPLIRFSRQRHEVSHAGRVLQVIVFVRHGRYVGLVVDTIEDITDEAAEVRREQRQDLCFGSAVIQHQVMDLVDVDSVLNFASRSHKNTAIAERA